MPRVGVGIEYGGFLRNGENFSSALRYQLLLDLWQYKRHLLYMDFDGETSFGVPNESLAFNRLHHKIAILGYRYDLGDYYGGLRFYHRCFNPYRERGRLQSDLDRTIADTFYVGLEFIDKAMLVGQKDRGINFEDRLFEFLGKWHVALSLNRVISKEFSKMDWLVTGRVRFDILRYCNLIPYLEAGGEVLGMQRWAVTPVVEGGVRFHGPNVDFIPFIQWGRTQEWPRQPSGQEYLVSHSYLFGGGRLEFLLDRENQSSGRTDEKLQLFPEVHGLAEYSLYLGSRYHLGFGSVRLHFDVLRWQSLTLFANPGFTMDSHETNFGPDKLWYQLDYGLRYSSQKYFLEGFVLNERRLDAFAFRDLNETAQQAGGRLGTKGMLLGHYDEGINFEGLKGFRWLNQLNAVASLAHYFDTQDWPYLWNTAAQARWDVLRWHFMVPYLQGGLEWRSASRDATDAFEYFIEPGIRCKGVLDLALFYRFQHQETIRSSRGPSENQNLIGIRSLF
ncbi:MAG: hypothetical protein NTY36_17760 [Deltaproteobacteria bacterium]|nr:hypothetical protein [Deltaproteobacteria bacterium]